MKMTNYIMKVLFQTTFVAVILLVASCTNYQKPEDNNNSAKDQNQAVLESDNQERDAKFLVNAAEFNLETIQLGQLAQQKSSTSHVKELGKMMEEAHTKSLSDLRALSKSKMITIPNSPTNDAKETYTKLNEKLGNDFDKAYSDKMVRAHKDAIDNFEKASTDCEDNDIKNWARTSLPVLRTHLQHSIECKEKCDNM